MFDINRYAYPRRKGRGDDPQLNPKGFESYELDFNSWDIDEVDLTEHAAKIRDSLDGRTVGALGRYGNTLLDEKVRRAVEKLIDSARLYGCDVVSVFAGGNPEKSVPDTIPEFKRVFETRPPRRANGVRSRSRAAAAAGGAVRRTSRSVPNRGADVRRRSERRARA